ncbi:SigE family RNA polymerase sigma factor [Nocardioides sp. Y6]|uniref:SigE family RNA polymerase sigma factor n=1 Tax=Nocardioides malaquae TaxID=2773426 RepID=A0ABR9RPH9_9ACTN|nr:SigE family RNA polymerase sigma factor [Nocardioides malaquae]MBE7323117.1 SigE family RNA polymerase sigma factor [Nocardioides malaquae]
MAAPEEFTEFVASRHAALVRTARLLVADEHAAEDLVQEALARCVPAWSRIEGNPEAYVRTVMVRTNISRWRRRRVAETSVARLPETAVHDADVEGREELRAALAGLPPRQRAVVVLRYVEDRPEREVAETLGCSVGTVKSQAHAGLAKLRTLLGTDASESQTAPAASLTP